MDQPDEQEEPDHPGLPVPAGEQPAPTPRGSTFFGETHVEGDAVAGDKYVIAPKAATPPGQLPRDDPCFRGRRAVLKYLDGLLARAAAGGEGPLVIVVQGMPGVGKTALAVHWAHRIAGRYPAGHLYVDLRGHSPRAVMTPPEALSRMLRALGVPGEVMPDDDDAQAALFRSHLADRRMLVILDNAASSDQIHPLLPAGPRCVTIVTSRNRLPGLIARGGVYTVDLDVMPPHEALDLVAAIVGEEQASAEAEAAAELAVQCAYLPLALRIAAANQKVRPHDTLADTVRELEGGDRLSALALDDNPKQSAVRTAFDLSYRDLTDEQKRAFCLLGLVEGPDFGDEAVAALLGAFPDDAQRVLRSLTQANLVQQISAHRYRLHDLLRDYAKERMKTEDLSEERDAAVRRLLGWLLSAAQDAARRVNPHRRVAAADSSLPRTQDLKDALTWFEEERGVLVAATAQAFAAGLHRETWQLADAMFDFLDLRTYTQDNLEVHRLGYQAADLTKDAPARAVMLRHMAVIHRELCRYDRAIQVGEEARRLFRELGDSRGEAESLDTLASAQWNQGRYDKVRELIGQALPVRQRIGDRMGEANCLHDLSRVHRRIGRCDVALAYDLEALDVRQELGDPRGEAEAFYNLSRIYCQMGLYDWARRDAERALDIAADLGDQHLRARALASIADINRQTGETDQVLGPAEEALGIQQRIADSRGEGITRDNLARYHLLGGRLHDALEQSMLALEVDRRRQDPYDRAHKLHTVGIIHTRLGNRDEAMANFIEELALLGEVGDLRGTATTHLAMAELCVDSGRDDEGLEHARLSIDIERGYHNPFAVGRRLLIVAQLVERVSGATAAESYRQEADRLLADYDLPDRNERRNGTAA
ncbi:MAG TPA: tetratricopeptide repeat protein [Streptosporangiaceae bacterium]